MPRRKIRTESAKIDISKLDICDIKSWAEQSYAKKYGEFYYVRYVSILTGDTVRLSIKQTGRHKTKAEADQWIANNIEQILENEKRMLERQQWRTAAKILKLTMAYEAYKKIQAPKSYNQELSALKNYVLPYFISEEKKINPNDWFKAHKKFKYWLLAEARTDEGEKLAVSSANKAINALNKFSQWLHDAEELGYDNLRPLASYPASMQKKKGAEELLDDQEYQMIYEALVETDQLWADIWEVQYWTGMRRGEVVGLMFSAITTTDSIPEEITRAYKKADLTLYGAIYLESQPAQNHMLRIQ